MNKTVECPKCLSMVTPIFKKQIGDIDNPNIVYVGAEICGKCGAILNQ